MDEVMRRDERDQQEEEEDQVDEEVVSSLKGRRRSNIHPRRGAEEADAEDVQELLKDHLAPEEEESVEEKTEAPAYARSLEIPDACIDEAPKLNVTEDSIAAQGSPPLQKLVTAVGKTSDGRIEKIKGTERKLFALISYN